MEWISDGMWKCGVCDNIFQVYVLNSEEVFSECGCPVCGVVVPPFKKIESNSELMKEINKN